MEGGPERGAASRLSEQWLDRWSAEVRQNLFLSKEETYRTELVSLVSALLLSAQMLGFRVSPESDLPDIIEALLADATVNAGLPPDLVGLQDIALRGAGASASRADLQNRLLRMASFAQGDGDPSALDVPRLADAVASIEYPPQRIDSFPSEVQRYIAVLTQKLSEVDSLLGNLQELLPPTCDIAPGELRSTVASVNEVLEKAATGAHLPTGVDRRQIKQDGAELQTG